MTHVCSSGGESVSSAPTTTGACAWWDNRDPRCKHTCPSVDQSEIGDAACHNNVGSVGLM